MASPNIRLNLTFVALLLKQVNRGVRRNKSWTSVYELAARMWLRGGSMTLSEFQAWTRAHDAATGWDGVPLGQLACRLAEEAGELVRSINRIYEYRGEIREQHERNIAVELVDTAWYLFKIANRFGISVDSELSAFSRKEQQLPAGTYGVQLANLLDAYAAELTADQVPSLPRTLRPQTDAASARERSAREYPATPLPSIHAVVVREGKVLLVRRANEPSPGRWSLPGGKIELGETLSDAVEREVREETGTIVRFRKIVDAYSNVVRDEEGTVRFHYVVLYCLCAFTGGEPKPCSDASEVAWVSTPQVEQLDMHVYVKGLLRKAASINAT